MGDLALALSFASKLLDKFPDYDQRKKSKFFDDQKRYNEEIRKDYPLRDDDLILNLKEDLVAFMKAFNEELS